MWLLFWIMMFSFPPPRGYSISSLSLLSPTIKDNRIHLHFPPLCMDSSQLLLILFAFTHFDLRVLPPIILFFGNDITAFGEMQLVCGKLVSFYGGFYENTILNKMITFRLIKKLFKNSINRTLDDIINLHCISMSLPPKWVLISLRILLQWSIG